MNFNCKIIERNSSLTLSSRKRTSVNKLPELLEKGYSEIISHLQKNGENPTGPAYAIYYNMDMRDLDIEYGVQISKKVTNTEDVKVSEIPEGKFASCVFTGPYSDIEPAYGALLKYVKEKKLETTGIAIEIYLNDPHETPSNELKTEILYQLK